MSFTFDVYALGAVFYFVVEGVEPFVAPVISIGFTEQQKAAKYQKLEWQKFFDVIKTSPVEFRSSY